MSIQQARKAAKDAMLYGYRHHTYEIERQHMNRYFRGQVAEPYLTLALPTYADVLAPERWRAIKNSVICFITITSRAAIDNGLDSEYSFAMSDYYINEVERLNNEKEMEALIHELLVNYRELVQMEVDRQYSQPVAHAVKYIRRNIYERCRVQDAAEAAGVHTSYLAALFKKELHCSPLQYITEQKIEESKQLLGGMNQTVAQVAEALGFSSTAHFSSVFKKHTGKCPSAWR